jgi:hypothetical protein
MQASSTQKTKDSAGRRLGYPFRHSGSKCSETRRCIRMTLSLGSVGSSGKLERT